MNDPIGEHRENKGRDIVVTVNVVGGCGDNLASFKNLDGCY